MDSIASNYDPETEDSCIRIDPDGLDQLAEIIKRLYPIASMISLCVDGVNDEASFEAVFVHRYAKGEIVLTKCKSNLKDKHGRMAEAARNALEILRDAAGEAGK